MSKKLENKKRSILESLNGHLQVQAVRLMNVDLETNIFPDSKLQLNNHKAHKPIVHKRNNWNKTVSIEKNPVLKRPIISNNQKIRKLKPYDPLYTWNRGGRLKELRIRCQARKFFYLWRNKSIGHITYVKAEQHYKHRLIKTVWKTWYDQYWLLRIEPRLYGKAILFRKLILKRTVFMAWNIWTKSQNQERLKFEIAVKYNNNFLKKWAFNNWISWIFVNRCKIKLNMISENQARRNTLIQIFSFWKMELKEKLNQNIKMSAAITHYNALITQKTFIQWVKVRPLLRQSKLNHCKVSNHHDVVIQKRMFDKWIQYHNKKKVNLKEKEKLETHYNWNVAHRHLMMWKYQYTQRIIQSAFVAKANKLAGKFQLQKYFTFWKQYHIDQQIQLSQLRKAEMYRNKIIKKNAWSNIMRFMAVSKQKMEMRRSANLCSNIFILRHHLHIWIMRFEEKDNNNQQLEIGAARSHYRLLDRFEDRSMFLKCLQGWSRFILISKSINKKNNSACLMHERNVLRRVMGSWKTYVSLSQYTKNLSQIEQGFIKKNVLEKFWLKWRDEHHNRQSINKLLVDYIQHKAYNRKKEIFRKWYLLTNWNIRQKQMNDEAILHFRISLLRKYFRLLQDNVSYAVRKQTNVNLANINFEETIKCKIFFSWRKYCLNKQHHRDLLLSRYRQIIINIKRNVFNSWKTLVKEKSVICSIADILFTEKRNNFISQVFQSWQQYGKTRCKKKSLTFLFVTEMRCKLENSQKKTILEKWRKRCSIVVAESMKASQADQQFYLKCLKKYFDAWTRHQHDRSTKLSMKQQSLSFWNRLQQVRVWYVWRQALIDKQREQYYTRFALVHWAHKLQERVFFGWVQYTVYRKKQINLEMNAMSLYKDRLRIYTLRQWIHSADFLEQWRHEHEKIDSKTPNIVVRAIEQWKRFTRAKSIKPLGSRHLISTCVSHLERDHSNLKIFPKNHRVPRIRPQPKVPEFIFGSARESLIGNQDPICSRVEDQSSRINREALDEPLLAPVCFQNTTGPTSNQINENPHQREKQLLNEITEIKDRLQHLKESKNILRSLEQELSEYDAMLSNVSLINADSSFYQEFNPLHYREQLYGHIKDLEAEIDRDTPQCLLLSKRFQQIMEQLQSDRFSYAM